MSVLPVGIVLDSCVAQEVYKVPVYNTKLSPGRPEEFDQFKAWLDSLAFPCFVATWGTLDGKPGKVGTYYLTPQSHAVWSPSKFPDQALKVVDKMAKLGYWFDSHSPWRPGDQWVGGFTPHGVTGWNDEPDHCCLGESFQHVVCLAALKTMEAMANGEQSQGSV